MLLGMTTKTNERESPRAPQQRRAPWATKAGPTLQTLRKLGARRVGHPKKPVGAPSRLGTSQGKQGKKGGRVKKQSRFLVATLLGMTAFDTKTTEGFAGRHRRQNARFDFALTGATSGLTLGLPGHRRSVFLSLNC